MKPSSIIFLIVSVVVLAAGLVLCTTGSNLAKEQGIALFATDVTTVNGDVISTDTFTDEVINKVKINLNDVDVHICPSETGESYIELVNFQVGTYDYSVQNKMLLVDNETSIFSIMHIAEGNFNFNGLRHYLTYRPNKNTEKAMTLYLADTQTVKTFEITVRSGNVLIEGFECSADYAVDVSAGNVMLSSVSSRSSVSVTVGTGEVIFDGVSAATCDVTVKNGSADLFIGEIFGSQMNGIRKGLHLDVLNGNAEVGYGKDLLFALIIDMSAPKGTVTYNGEQQENGLYKYLDNYGIIPLEIEAHAGNAVLSMGASATLHNHEDFDFRAVHEEPAS